MICLRWFAGQVPEELAFASFTEQRFPCRSTICTKPGKHGTGEL
jgi:hypothetical protein